MEQTPTFDKELSRAREEWQEITRKALRASLNHYSDRQRQQLAGALGIGQSYLKGMLDGDRAASGEAFLRLAAATQTPVVDLLLRTIAPELLDDLVPWRRR